MKLEVEVEIFLNDRIVLKNIPIGFVIPLKRREFISSSQINNKGLRKYILEESDDKFIMEETPIFLEIVFTKVLINSIAKKEDEGEDEWYIQPNNIPNYRPITKSKIGKSVLMMKKLDEKIKIKGSEPKDIKEIKVDNKIVPCDLHINLGTHGVGQIDDKISDADRQIYGISGIVEVHFPIHAPEFKGKMKYEHKL